MDKDCIVFIIDESLGPFGSDFRIRRCLHIAQRLQQSHPVYFLAPRSVRESIQDRSLVFMEADFEDIRSCALCLEKLSAKVAVFDLPEVPLEFLLLLRGLGILIIAIDDQSEIKNYIDIRINPTTIKEGSDFKGLKFWVPDSKWAMNPHHEMESDPANFVFKVNMDTTNDIPKLQDMVRLLRARGHPARIFISNFEMGSGPHNDDKNVIVDFEKGLRLLNKASVIINVGLTDLFDLLQLNRPLACLRKTEAEGNLINQLLPEGGVFDLGVLANEENSEICDKLIKILNEPESIEYHTALASNIISQDNIEEVCDIINVVKVLPWDTRFFGFPVAFLSSLKLNPAIIRFVFDFCSKRQVRLLEYQCDCHDRESVLLTEKHGFNFADIRLTFERFIYEESEVPKLPSEFSFDIAKEKDTDRLMEIAGGLYLHSRYYFDKNFPRDKVCQFYVDWVRKAVLGAFDDCAMILRHGDAPVAFFTIKYESNYSARIRLVGIDPHYRAKGLAQMHLSHCLRELAANGVKYVQVTTQGRNYAAQRLYQKAGFVTKKTELWYHKWFKWEELPYH